MTGTLGTISVPSLMNTTKLTVFFRKYGRAPWGVVILACAAPVFASDMAVVLYRDQDPGTAAYVTRIMVTPQYMRLDNGVDDQDFVLLNRKTGELTNVLHELKTNMRIRNKLLPADARPTWRADEKVEEIHPGTRRITLSIHGEVCSKTVSAKKLMPDVAKALAEYNAALAWTQYRTYLNSPEDMRDDCDLVRYVWESGRSLSYGLPIEEVDYQGRTRRLEKQFMERIRPSLFSIPSGYKVVYATEQQMGP
jgi:hypothetical protein